MNKEKTAGYGIETDLYSLGIIFYNLLYGRSPFLSKTLNDLNKKKANNQFEFDDFIDVSEAAKKVIT